VPHLQRIRLGAPIANPPAYLEVALTLEAAMESIVTFAGVTAATLVALFAALALELVLLKAMFNLLRPLSLSRRKAALIAARDGQSLEQGAQLLARAYSKPR
jgi:hypothetical protein